MILRPKMRVTLTREINDPTCKVEAGSRGHIVRINQHSGQSGVALVQFDAGALRWVNPERLEPN